MLDIQVCSGCGEVLMLCACSTTSTDEKALREKLEQLFAEARARMGIRVTDSKTLNRRDFTAVESVALDLLARLDAAETPCVWSVDDDGIWTATCGEVEWCFNDGGPVENKVKRCYGCGHPVQVKQPQDAERKEEK